MADERKDQPNPDEAKGKPKRFSGAYMNFELPPNLDAAPLSDEDTIEAAEIVEDEEPLVAEEVHEVHEVAEAVPVEAVEHAADIEAAEVVEEEIVAEVVDEDEETGAEEVKADVVVEASVDDVDFNEVEDVVHDVAEVEEERLDDSKVEVLPDDTKNVVEEAKAPEIVEEIHEAAEVIDDDNVDLVVAEIEEKIDDSKVEVVEEPLVVPEVDFSDIESAGVVAEEPPAVAPPAIAEELVALDDDAVEVVASSKKLVDSPLVEDTDSAVHAEEVLVEGAPEIHETQPIDSGERPSGIDIVDAALESGVDLAEPSGAKKKIPSESDIDLDEILGEEGESSAVDLGSPGTAPAGPKSPSPHAIEAAVDDAAVEEVDEKPAPAPKDKKGRGRERELVGAGGRGRGGFMPFLIGFIISAAVVGGGGAAAWYLNMIPQSPSAPKTAAIKPIATIPPAAVAPVEPGEAKVAAGDSEEKLKAAEKKIEDLEAAVAAAKDKGGDKGLVDGLAKANAELAKSSKELAKANSELAASQKKVAAVDGELAKAGIKDQGANGIAELIKSRDAADKGREKLDAVIDAALQELKQGHLVGDEGDKLQQLVQASKVAGDKAQNNFAEAPEHQLDTILAVLGNREFNDAKELGSYKRFLDWTRSKDAKSSPEMRAKALYGLGLLQRSQNNFDAARQTLQEVTREASALKNGGALQMAANNALKNLTNPATQYAERAEANIAAGRFKAATTELNAGLKAFPDQPHLLLMRAEAALEAGKRSGKFDPATQQQIRADAEAARRDPALAAESYYLIGRLDEQVGQYASAESNYRAAFKMAATGDQADRYRVALARILQRGGTAGIGGLEFLPDAGQLEEFAPQETVEVSFVDEPAAQIGSGEGLPDPATRARLEESMRLAQELIKKDDPKTRGEGYMLLGSAQARLGSPTEGLLNLVKGMRLANPDWSTQELERIINTLPLFRDAGIASQPNPLMAEKHFSKGLEYFWSSRYFEAEAELVKAVSYYDDDARYRYFLGMSRQMLGKTSEAQKDFEKGAQLERARHPSTREVNASLERVQGYLRTMIDAYRAKGRE